MEEHVEEGVSIVPVVYILLLAGGRALVKVWETGDAYVMERTGGVR